MRRRGLSPLPLSAKLPAGAEVEPLPARFARHPTVIVTSEEMGLRGKDDPVTISVMHDESGRCAVERAVASFEDGADGELREPPERQELSHGFVVTGAFRREGGKLRYRIDHCDDAVRVYCSAGKLATEAQLEAVERFCASIRRASR